MPGPSPFMNAYTDPPAPIATTTATAMSATVAPAERRSRTGGEAWARSGPGVWGRGAGRGAGAAWAARAVQVAGAPGATGCWSGCEAGPRPPGPRRRIRGCLLPLRLLRVFGVEQPHRLAGELGEEGGGQPGFVRVRRVQAGQDLVGTGAGRRVLRQAVPDDAGQLLGTPLRSGSSWAIRNIREWTPPLSAVPNGSRPDAAYARTDPRQNTSHAVVTRSPRTCSGAMNPGEPTRTPVRVRSPSATDSRARAMPKSMTRGPSMVIRTLEGFRSRWMSPAPWMCWRAWASPDPRNRTERAGSGPYAPEAVTGAPGRPETTRWREGPAT